MSTCVGPLPGGEGNGIVVREFMIFKMNAVYIEVDRHHC